MPNASQAETAKPNSFPLVWVVPVLALLVGGYMIVKELSGRGPQITVVFEEGAGLEAGKTPLHYKGLAVGLVESVALSPDLGRVEAVITLQQSAKGLAREGSKFWILRPKIGFEGITGLDTLISGPIIQAEPGVGPFADRFQGLQRAPLEGSELGYHYILTVKRLGSLKVGSPVLYRDVKVGEIVETSLAPDATGVRVQILVNSPYDKLVRNDTVFWNASGVAMKVGLFGATINTNSLESLLVGGVLFATPDDEGELAELAPEGAVFELHSEARQDWLDWQPAIPLQ